ncbi:hypothetical protein HDU96_009341 [Phlyctochytrium bullatum]|nr:hypothetical protein HDU96_009341 [Phlyctochytrium bullatum]
MFSTPTHGYVPAAPTTSSVSVAMDRNISKFGRRLSASDCLTPATGKACFRDPFKFAAKCVKTRSGLLCTVFYAVAILVFMIRITTSPSTSPSAASALSSHSSEAAGVATPETEPTETPFPPSFPNPLSDDRIPKRLWTYWDKDTLPTWLSRNVATWRFLNPDHNITIVTPSTLREHVGIPLPPFFHLGTHGHRREWAKLAVLLEHGGMFLDPAVHVVEPLAFVHAEHTRTAAQVLAYHNPALNTTTAAAKDPWHALTSSVEPHFLAAVPRARLLWAWFNEYNYVLGNFMGSDGMYLEYLTGIFGNTPAFWTARATLASAAAAFPVSPASTPVSVRVALGRVLAERAYRVGLPAPLNRRGRGWDLAGLVPEAVREAGNERRVLAHAAGVAARLAAVARWNVPAASWRAWAARVVARRPAGVGQDAVVKGDVGVMEHLEKAIQKSRA